MLPNRKINMIESKKKQMIMQYGGIVDEEAKEKEQVASGTGASGTDASEKEPVGASETGASEKEPVASGTGASGQVAEPVKEESYKAPGVIASLASLSEYYITQAIDIAKNAIMSQLKIKGEGQTSGDLYKEITDILEDPKTQEQFLELSKSVAKKGLTFIQVTRPMVEKTVDAVLEILDEIGAKGGKSMVKISKDVVSEVPILGQIIGAIFLFDDIVKFWQSLFAAMFQTGTKGNELIVEGRRVASKAGDIDEYGDPDIKAASEEVSKATDTEKTKAIVAAAEDLKENEEDLEALERQIKELEEQISKGTGEQTGGKVIRDKYETMKRTKIALNQFKKTNEVMQGKMQEKEVIKNKKDGKSFRGGRVRKTSKIYKSQRRRKSKKYLK
jgi:hypothetical protein